VRRCSRGVWAETTNKQVRKKKRRTKRATPYQQWEGGWLTKKGFTDRDICAREVGRTFKRALRNWEGRNPQKERPSTNVGKYIVGGRGKKEVADDGGGEKNSLRVRH